MTVGVERQRQDFSGLLMLGGNQHSVRGSMETIRTGGWLGVFLKPKAIESIPELKCALQIGEEEQTVLLGPFLAIGDDVAVCFRTQK